MEIENGMTVEEKMTFTRYRESFSNAGDFMRAFGKLSLQEAQALISAEKHSTCVKACMITIWQNAKREIDENERRARKKKK